MSFEVFARARRVELRGERAGRDEELQQVPPLRGQEEPAGPLPLGRKHRQGAQRKGERCAFIYKVRHVA